MRDLRQKIGHEKGKLWTAMLNKMTDSIIKHREDRVAPREMSRRLVEAYSHNLGSLVAAINKIPRSSEGKLVEAWENEFLCSNPHLSKNEATGGAAKEAEKKLEGSSAEGAAGGAAKLPGDEVYDAEWWVEATYDNEIQPVRPGPLGSII